MTRKTKISLATVPSIIIDTREINAFTFASIEPQPALIYQALPTGDYSLVGHEDQITIERKSLCDLYGSVGAGRERFEREFQRMTEFDYAALVIEADLGCIIKNPPEYSRMRPKAVFRTLLSWSLKYGVYVWPCPDRGFAEKTTYLLLKFWWEKREKQDGRNNQFQCGHG